MFKEQKDVQRQLLQFVSR